MKTKWWLIFALAVAVAATAANAGESTVPWKMDALSQAPRTYPAPGFDAEGVRALFYEGLPFQGKPTRVFAWYGAPSTEAGRKSPAMVLVHGGGGTAFSDWVKLWNKRGYAAIAMDTCGSTPGGETPQSPGAQRPRHEFSGPPGWGGFDHIGDPVQDQWTYHAVAGVVLANSLIRSFPEVDADRIGVTGISWGGYLTCIVVGVDKRFRFAVPVYGCGFLGDDSKWLDTFRKMGPDATAKWLALWDPSVYLPNAAKPMLWVTGTNDFAYPMDSLQKSYRLPTGPRTLCIRLRMPHGHGGPGENPEEIRAFADSTVNGGAPLASVTGQGRDGQSIWTTFAAKVPVAKAELNYTKDVGPWQDRQWDSVPAQIDTANSKVTGTLPKGTTTYYVNLIDQRDRVVSTEHMALSK